MEKFRYVADANYNNKTFFVFSSESCFKFFIRKSEEGSLKYPTLEEFRYLNNIFNVKKEKASDVEDTKTNGKLVKGSTYKFNPKVIFKGTLLPLAAALTLCGCGLQYNEVENNQPVVEETYSTENYEEKKYEDYTNEDWCEFYGLKYEELPGGIMICKGASEASKYTANNICTSSDEFKQYLGQTDCSYNDLRETLNQNINISDEYKQWLHEGIDNFEKSGIGMNLDTLNYNLGRMRITEKSVQEIINDGVAEKSIAYFDSKDGSVVVNRGEDEEINKFVLYHEVFGHGTTEAYIGDYAQKTFAPSSISVSEGNEQYKSISTNDFADGFKEGVAEVLANIAFTGTTEIEYVSYEDQREQLMMAKDLFQVSYEDLIDNGIPGLISKMDENVACDFVKYVDNVDCSCRALLDGLNYNGISKEKNMSNLIDSYARNNVQSKEHIDDITNKWIKTKDVDYDR